MELTTEQRAWVEDRARVSARDPAVIVGQAVKAAFRQWQEANPEDTRFWGDWDHATGEARRVAEALLAREAQQPGFIERLAVLPRDKQTPRIRAEVYPYTRTAYVWTSRHEHYMVLAQASGGSEAVGQLPSVERTGSRLQWWRRRVRLWCLRTVASMT